MDSHPTDRPNQTSNTIAQLFRKPQFLLPAVIVAGMLGVAFGIQPGGGNAGIAADELSAGADTATTAAATPTPTPSPTPSPTASPTNMSSPADAETIASPTSEVAGVQETAEPERIDEPDLTRQATECGAIQETSMALGVEQNIANVSVRAQGVAVYPAEYFRCILLATGGREAVALSTAVGEALAQGSTHVVLVDLWITNGAGDFAQVNLKQAIIAAAGQTFSPIATLGGRAEVVVSSGQGRNVTLVGVLTNQVGATTGPITVSIDAPLVGGHTTPGKYQLFLPTP